MITSLDPELALVVIAKNEARCIDRCLKSAKEQVDRMVVLDTGSTDNTVKIARSCGAEVYSMIWPGDFSVARNHALMLVNADWHLILDADEWIESGAECLRPFISQKPALGVVRIRNFLDDSPASPTSSSWVSRLLPRGVLYQGAIHEQPFSDLARTRLPLVFGHDGYLPSQTRKKKGRDRELLETELIKHPDDPYLLYQLGKNFEVYGDCLQAWRLYEQAINQIGTKAPYSHDLTVRALYCMGKTGQVARAIELAQDWLADWMHSPDFFFILGNLWLDWSIQNPDRAIGQGLPMARLAWEQCLKIGERPTLEGAVQGRGSFLAERNLKIVSSPIEA